MKNKKPILLAILLLAALACKTLTQDLPATPTSDYVFPEVTTPLVIEPGSLPKGELGAEYEVQILVRDNVTPISSVIISEGALPAGLELVFVDNDTSFTIRGKPEETGSFTFTIFVSCFGTMVSGQTAQVDYTIIVE
ncbi:MAG TPA: hypothetical protein PKE23_08610 [Anaerolineales bacterium]|nr:hypothetical protein [Anaerolineales bacterium]